MTLPRRTLRSLLLACALGASACAMGAAEIEGDELADVDAKADSPFAQEGGPCVTSFDCEVGLECHQGGCVPRPDVCEDRR